jgi:hypothetical protein
MAEAHPETMDQIEAGLVRAVGTQPDAAGKGYERLRVSAPYMSAVHVKRTPTLKTSTPTPIQL